MKKNELFVSFLTNLEPFRAKLWCCHNLNGEAFQVDFHKIVFTTVLRLVPKIEVQISFNENFSDFFKTLENSVDIHAPLKKLTKKELTLN